MGGKYAWFNFICFCFGMSRPAGNSLRTSTIIFLQRQLSSHRILTKSKALQKVRPSMNFAIMLSCYVENTTFSVLACEQFTVTFPTISTDCLLYPMTWTPLQGQSFSSPFNLVFSWPKMFNGMTLISTPVSCFPLIGIPFIWMFEKDCVGDIMVNVFSSNCLL